MKKFILFERELEFTEDECNHREIDYLFVKIGEESRQAFINIFESEQESDEFLNIINKSVVKFTMTALELIVDKLFKQEIYDIDIDSILVNHFSDIFELWEIEYNKFEEKYMQIRLSSEEMIQYRALRKDSRSRWWGGGFGLSGAIKGVATASALNAVTGVGHSIKNAIGNSITTSRQKKQIRELIKNSDTCANLSQSIYRTIHNLKDIYIDIIVSRNNAPVKYYSLEEKQLNQRLINNAERMGGEAKSLDLLIQSIKIYPYAPYQYVLLTINYGDRLREIETIAQFFNIDMREMKEAMLKTAFEKVDYSNEESMSIALEEVATLRKSLGYTVRTDYEKYIEEKMQEHNLDKRSITDVISSYDAKNDKRAYLTDGDVITYDTREKASQAAKAKEEICNIYKNVDLSNEESLMESIKSIAPINKEFNDLGKNVLRELETRKKILNKDMRTVNEVEYSTYEEAQAERAKIIDGKRYDTIEQAEFVRGEKVEIEKIGDSKDTLVNLILTYGTISNMDFKSDYALDYIGKMENDIKKGYYDLEVNKDSLFGKQLSFLFWVALSIGITGIGVLVFLAGSLVIKIISAIIVLSIIGNAMTKWETVGECKAARKELTQIEKMISVQGNNIVILNSIRK